MQITLRTLPRDDGQTSVILTRSPGDPRDPEVVNVFPTSRSAVFWLAKMALRIKDWAGARYQGGGLQYALPEMGKCSARFRAEIEVGDGEELRVIE